MIRLVVALLTFLPLSAMARTSDLCDSAAERAAAETGVPLDLLRAITRVETGRDGVPWPWTLNIGGRGEWFATADQAVAALERAKSDGEQQIDVGCFQLNLRWHGERFADLSSMLDPRTNARQAANFLSELQAQTGDWRTAASAYHSRTPELAEAYLTRLEAVYDATLLDAPADTDRQNGYPLLMSGEIGAVGSLVPRGRRLAPLVGVP